MAPPAAPAYEAGMLKRHVDQFTKYDTDWNDWFAREQIEPLRLTYKAMPPDPFADLRAVLDVLGIERAAARDVTPDTA